MPFYCSVPSERQKKALDFLMRQLDDLDWLDNKELMSDMPLMGNPSDIVREYVMKMVLGSPAKLDLSASKAKDEPYTVDQCLDDVFEYVWGPAKRREKLTESQMKTQKAFLRHVGQGAGVNFGKPSGASLTDFVSEDKLAWSAAEPGEISAAGEPNMAYYIPKQYEDLYFDYVLKVRKLLEKSHSCKDKASRLHYGMMLHMLDKAME